MTKERLAKLLNLLWLLPGFLLWAAYPPMGERADVLFALAPLMWLSRRAKAGASAKRWFASGMLYWICTLSWMPAIVKNSGPWPLVALGWIALSAYCAAYFAAYGYISAKTWEWARGAYPRRLFAMLVAEPVLWCGLELVRSRFGGGFAWNHLGVVPANSGFGAPAALGGVYLLSAVVILVNGSVAGIAERMWRPELSGLPKKMRFGSLETIAVFAVVFGIYKASALGRVAGEAAAPGHMSVALVQRNFPCVFKGRAEENPVEVYSRLLANVEALKPDVFVLSESAMCEFGPVDQQGAVRFAESIVGRTGASVLAGGTRYEESETYNAAALYGRDGSFQVYDKAHLVPFGEFIPGDKTFKFLQKFAPVGSCTPGRLKTLDLPVGEEKVPVGVAICFEDTDSAQMCELARLGARALFFITNDSWFSDSVEAEQHSWQSVARAIETGLPVARTGNSGVSGTISPDGRAMWLVGADGIPLVDRGGTMFDRLQLGGKGATTFYVRVGDWPLGTAFLLLILSMVLVKYWHHYEKRRKLSM